jgi:hypothetical protein
MNLMNACCSKLAGMIVLYALVPATAPAQLMPKPQVANLIVKVENGVDQFRDYLKRRGENAQAANSSAQGDTRRARRGSATDAQKANASARKDELESAMDGLNTSTNRLRRKFDATDKWIETRAQMERVMDDARKINPIVARGNYGAEAARLWGVLRSGINDLARAYGIQPMAI